MVMVSDPGTVQLPYSGVNVGRVEQWDGDRTTWDGWADIPGAATEELVCNGGTRDWCVYMVVKRYQKHLIDELAGATYWADVPQNDRDFTEKSRMVSECFDLMRNALNEHYQEIRREQARVRQGLRQS
jgi:hypothetical protein